MGDTTKISWTDKTWNCWYGCHKTSSGCKNCYMFRDMAHYGREPNVVVRSKTTFNAPLKWKEPAKVFTCSWSDFFIEEADGWREEAWDIIRKTPHLTYQILTKRPERISEHLPADWGNGYPNVWLGVSVENQKAANERIPLLLQIPSKVRFLSCEPLLEEINLREWLCGGFPPSWGYPNEIHQIIVGGESGPNFRLMDLAWARIIRDDCQMSGVSFFYKQESALRPGTNPTLDGKIWHEFPKVT